jgi:hypothetical protein
MYLAKLNQNDCKNCKSGKNYSEYKQLRRLYTIALRALGWEPLPTERKKLKQE